MTNLQPSERPTPPSIAWDSREKLACMRRAVAGAIAHGNEPHDIKMDAWANHFACDLSDIQSAWEAEIHRILRDRQPMEGDGK